MSTSAAIGKLVIGVEANTNRFKTGMKEASGQLVEFRQMAEAGADTVDFLKKSLGVLGLAAGGFKLFEYLKESKKAADDAGDSSGNKLNAAIADRAAGFKQMQEAVGVVVNQIGTLLVPAIERSARSTKELAGMIQVVAHNWSTVWELVSATARLRINQVGAYSQAMFSSVAAGLSEFKNKWLAFFFDLVKIGQESFKALWVGAKALFSGENPLDAMRKSFKEGFEDYIKNDAIGGKGVMGVAEAMRKGWKKGLEENTNADLEAEVERLKEKLSQGKGKSDSLEKLKQDAAVNSPKFERPAALLRGSAAAFTASFGQNRKDEMAKKQLDLAEKQERNGRDAIKAIEKIGDNNIVVSMP